MNPQPVVSIVVPHYNGKDMLYVCLAALEETEYEPRQVIVVDNASTDGSTDSLKQDFPWVELKRSPQNLGYAGGCNFGLTAAKGKYVLFLNNDTEFEPDWLGRLIACCESDSQIAACQPKLRALAEPEKFDYSGAAGGLIDRFGFPFARGRLFFTLETDAGQYDKGLDIFWASGTAMLVRRQALEEVGPFDADFFAHMEEIDLAWRLQLAGYRIAAVPQSVVMHNSGSTLPADSYKKMYLNHRNCLIMLAKNYEARTLLWILPLRIMLELAAAGYSLVQLDVRRVAAVFAAFLGFLRRLGATLRKRRVVQERRKVGDAVIFKNMYRGSVVWDYFVRQVRTVRELGIE